MIRRLGSLIILLGIPVATATAQELGPAGQDTVRAIQRLFKSRRIGADIGAGLAAATIITPYAIGEATSTPGRWVQSSTHMTVGIAVSLPLWVLVAMKHGRFSPEKERLLLLRYQQGQPLPRAIRRRLHPRFFRA